MHTAESPLVERAGAAGVLVVDDEFSVRDSLESWFKKDGYRVDSASDAMEAMRKLQNGSWAR